MNSNFFIAFVFSTLLAFWASAVRQITANDHHGKERDNVQKYR